MSSPKHPPLEYHSQAKNENRQKQSALRVGTISGASSCATVDDEKYYEYISEQMREIENRSNEKIKELNKCMQEYISEQMGKIENMRNKEIRKLKKYTEEYISKQAKKIENGRNEEITTLMKCREEFLKEKPQHSKDRKSKAVRTEAEQFPHEVVDRPLLNQNERTMENQAPKVQCYDSSTKATYDSKNGRMTSENVPANMEHLAMEVVDQNSIRMEGHSGADKRFDDSATSASRSANGSKMSGRTPAKTEHIFMEVTEYTEHPLAHPPTVQNAMWKGMGREICAQEYYDKSIKMAADSPKDSTIPGPAAIIFSNRSMEDTKESASHPSPHQVVAVRTGSEIGAKACHDYRLKTQADSTKNSVVSGHTPLSSSHLSMEVVEQNTLEAVSPRRLCVLLLGSSGNGKSSIGNSILGKDVFRTSSSVKSPTPCIAMDSAQVGDQTVQVVDGPSILDSRDADQDFMEQIVIAMEKSLTLCDYAFSAIVIVLRFGVRFTKQEVNTIKLIKSVLGENVIKDYGICAVTCGDNFEHAAEEAREDGEMLTFEGWCREQTGEVKALFEECGFRCVLFDNRTKDENMKNAQRQAFLKMVNPVKPYSKEEFLKAQTSLNKVIDTDMLIRDLEEETQKIIDNTGRDMEDLSEEDSLQHVDSLLKHLTDHQAMLRELGLSSPKLRELRISMQLLENEIGSKIRSRRLMKDNMSLMTPLSRSSSLPTSNQPPPSSRYGCCEQSLFSERYASGKGTESGNMGYTSSFNDWYIVQKDSSPLPTVRGHRGVSVTDWVKTKLEHIWEYIRLSTRTSYTL